MSSIETGSLATAVIGVIWIALAVIYGTDQADTVHNVLLGAAIAAVGMTTAIAARWWENRE